MVYSQEEIVMQNDHIGSNSAYEMLEALRIISVSKKKVGECAKISNSYSAYRAIFITESSAQAQLGKETVTVCPRDLIILPPHNAGFKADGENLGYTTIFFTGSEAKAASEKLGFSNGAALFSEVAISQNEIDSLSECTGEIANYRAKGLLYFAFSEILRKNNRSSLENRATTAAKKVKAYIDEFFIDPELSLKTIGEAISYHPNYISKVFNDAYGVNVAKYVNVLRVKHARFLMDGGENSLKTISLECGFCDTEYFSAVFKSHYGQTPKEYIKRIRSIDTIPD
jgi:AraC-like DNA-binding protein